MRVEKYEIMEVNIPLKREFKIALGSSTMHRSLILKVYGNGHIGYGEGAPSVRITGENMRGTREGIELIMAEVVGKEISLEHLHKIFKRIQGHFAAKAAVDIALHDLYAKILGIRVRDIYGGVRKSMETSITIGISSLKDTLSMAREYVEKYGAKILKIKVGENLEEDVNRIKEIRDLYPEVRIRVDANQGYNFHEAMEFFRAIKNLDIEFVEQPIPYWQLDKLSELRKRVDIPIMLDESVKNPYDLMRAIENKSLDMLNIKLMKCGGIRTAWSMIEICRIWDIPVMIGCMGETEIGIAAGTHLACATEVVKYADLDSHIILSESIVKGGIITKDGENHIYDSAGLGVEMK